MLSDSKFPVDSFQGAEIPVAESRQLLGRERELADSSRIHVFLLQLSPIGTDEQTLPPVAHTVEMAETLHSQIVGRAAKGKRIDCPELTGKTLLDQPLVGAHLHTHILPVDLSGDGLIDHVIIYAPGGFGGVAQVAIRSLDRTWVKSCRTAVSLKVTAEFDFSGRTSKLATSNPISRLISGCPIGSSWQSLTPFVPPRYLKNQGKNSLLGQVQAELASRGLPPASVTHLGTTSHRYCTFSLCRSPGHAQPPQAIGFSLRLDFTTAIAGPLILGYASHFGLGLFQAVESASISS